MCRISKDHGISYPNRNPLLYIANQINLSLIFKDEKWVSNKSEIVLRNYEMQRGRMREFLGNQNDENLIIISLLLFETCISLPMIDGLVKKTMTIYLAYQMPIYVNYLTKSLIINEIITIGYVTSHKDWFDYRIKVLFCKESSHPPPDERWTSQRWRHDGVIRCPVAICLRESY